MGYELSAEFCNRIFTHKSFQNSRLTPAEIVHAGKLAAAFKEFAVDDVKTSNHRRSLLSEIKLVSELASAKEVAEWMDRAIAEDKLNHWFGSNNTSRLSRLKLRLQATPNYLEEAKGELVSAMRANDAKLKSDNFNRYLNRIHERLALQESEQR